MQNIEQKSHQDILNPPGGLMVWIFVFSELIVFGAALVTFIYQRSLNIELFHSSRMELNQVLATMNTILLITSGFSIAMATKYFDQGEKKKTMRSLAFGLLLGCSFLIIKFFEYKEKFSHGFSLGSNTFFDYYWILTAFHALHIVLGIFILISIMFMVHKELPFKEDDFNFHTGAIYWHMCDLIWVLIFPVIYLL
ncbi:MAG: nitric oxide reductase [Halobacteriovoraceae bacterium]|nr:nitric oxide reductase [Halobacteriovoraceae bacterium]